MGKKCKNFKSIWIIVILSSKYLYFSFTIVHFIMQLYEIISHAKLIPSSPGSLSFQTLYYYWHKIYYHISHIKKKFLLRIHSHHGLSNFSAPFHRSRFSRVRVCVTPWTAAHQAPQSLGFSRQEHWSGLPCPPPMHESEM